MGCIQFGKSYFDVNLADERDLRKFENDLDAYTIDFHQIYQKIAHELNYYNTSFIKQILDNDFNNKFYDYLLKESNYFHCKIDEDVMIEANKVTSLIFLLSSSGFIANKFQYYSDKAYYFYLRCSYRDDEELNRSLTKNDDSLKTFIYQLVEIACIIFPRIYYKINKLDEKSLIKQAEESINEIVKFIINDLFTIKGKSNETLSFNELKEKFSNDNYYFSCGYVRAKGIECLNSLGKR